MKSIPRISWTGIIASVGIGTLLAPCAVMRQAEWERRGKHRSGDRCARCCGIGCVHTTNGIGGQCRSCCGQCWPSRDKRPPCSGERRSRPIERGAAGISAGEARRLREERRIRHLPSDSMGAKPHPVTATRRTARR